MTSYYSDKERVEIANKEYKDWSLEEEVRLKEGSFIGSVSQVNDKPSGEQSFVITDQYVSPTASQAERESVKEVTVLYRGSTGLDKTLEKPGDVYRDWVVNNSEMAHKILTSEQGNPPPQLVSSAETLKEAMELYPNANFSVYGHSLGSMNAQYAVSDLSLEDSQRISGGYFFQGPNIYNVLTFGQQNIATQLTDAGKLYNYVDDKDLVPIGYGDGKLSVGRLIPVLSKKVDLTAQHMWGGYQYDTFGNVLLDAKGKTEIISFETQQRISGLEGLKKKFLASGGGSLSSAQEIFLDASEAKAITLGYKQTVQAELDGLKKWFQNDITNENELWSQTKSDAQHWGEHLSVTEELEALEAGNATERAIVQEPVEEAEKSLSVLKASEEELSTLLGNIEKAIESQVALDKELANYLF
jgi:hypothetical protein